MVGCGWSIGSRENSSSADSIASRKTAEDTPVVGVPLIYVTSEPNNNCDSLFLVGSSNRDLIPLENISVSGVAPNCFATFIPQKNKFGEVDIRFAAVKGNKLDAKFQFQIIVSAVNDAPEIVNREKLTNIQTEEDASVRVDFVLADVDSVLDCKTSLSIKSSNEKLLPHSMIAFGGTLPNCFAVLKPSANQLGSTEIEAVVSDGAASSRVTFTLTVGGENDPPELNPMLDAKTKEDMPLVIDVAGHDPDEDANGKPCKGFHTSSNTDLLSGDGTGVVWSGLFPNCKVTLIPNPDKFGTAVVNLTSNDGIANSKPVSFEFIVEPVNDAPKFIQSVGPQSVLKNSSTDMTVKISDVDSMPSCSDSLKVMRWNYTLALTSSSFSFYGTAPNCMLRITPLQDQTTIDGPVTVTMRVTDAPGQYSESSFSLSVTSPP
jgi:hypothetical protein